MTDQTKLLEKIETQSSLYEKTDPDFRRSLDRAVIDRDPPTYKALYNKFKLAAKDISFMAFYRYARRLRAHAAMLELADLALPEGCDPVQILPKLLANRLLDAAIDESTSPRTLQRLTDAWRFAAQTQLLLERHQTTLDEIRRQAKNKETEQLCKVVKHYAALTRAQNTADTHQPHSTPDDLEPQPTNDVNHDDEED